MARNVASAIQKKSIGIKHDTEIIESSCFASMTKDDIEKAVATQNTITENLNFDLKDYFGGLKINNLDESYHDNRLNIMFEEIVNPVLHQSNAPSNRYKSSQSQKPPQKVLRAESNENKDPDMSSFISEVLRNMPLSKITQVMEEILRRNPLEYIKFKEKFSIFCQNSKNKTSAKYSKENCREFENKQPIRVLGDKQEILKGSKLLNGISSSIAVDTLKLRSPQNIPMASKQPITFDSNLIENFHMLKKINSASFACGSERNNTLSPSNEKKFGSSDAQTVDWFSSKNKPKNEKKLKKEQILNKGQKLLAKQQPTVEPNQKKFFQFK